MSVELATAYINLVPSARGFGAAVAAEAGAAGSAGGSSMASSFAGSLAGIGVAARAAVAAAGAAAGVGLVALGSEFDSAFDSIRVGTGATGTALEGLKDSAKDVLKDTPASIDDVGTAIADLNTRLGITGKPLEDLSAQFLDLSRITGTDVTTNIDNMTRVFGDAGIAPENYADSLDQMFRAAQASGIGLDELSSSAVQFGAPLRNLGFGLDESLALLAQFNRTGVNTETVMSGLKQGIGRVAKAGEDVPTTFRRVVDEISALGPGSEATGKAIELFGQRAGPDLADAITGGKFELDGMLAAITGGSDTISAASADTEDFGEKFAQLKNRAMVGLEPIATRAFDALGNGMDWVSAKAVPFVSELADVFKADGAGGVVERLGSMWDEAWPKMQERLAVLWEKARTWLVTVGLPALGRGIQAGASALWQWIQDAYPPYAQRMAEFWGKAINWLADVGLPRFGDWLKESAGPALWQWIQDAWPSFARTMAAFWARVGEWLVTTAVPWLLEKGAQLWAALGQWLWTEAVPSILRGLGSMLSALGQWFVGTAIPWLAQKGFELWSNLGQWLWTEAVPSILRALGGLQSSLATWFVGTAIPWLRTKAGELFATLREKAEEKGQEALDWLKDLPGKAVDAIGDLKTKLLGAGKDLVQGLWDGITDRWESMLDGWSALVDLLPEKLQKLLGIKSPSTVMAGFGTNIVEGLVKGIAKSSPMVDSQMSDLAGRVAGRDLTPARFTSTANPALRTAHFSAGSGHYSPAGDSPTIIHTQASDPQGVAAALYWQRRRARR